MIGTLGFAFGRKTAVKINGKMQGEAERASTFTALPIANPKL